ncbi:winged helix DNA-binding domain-containing protein [Paenibacillus sp. GD4]|uniref:winged helix DNA-binding domain-containing protein n=1 Tax=Paenibacillus sp. GD4 TaxID=3068890 RepID=UPI002796B3F7|nr:winged helix DNA-binding domain-containing protein [Paenibacillus sp. GD4]MDQ1909336.1 winged helix DNA-binding domain-containing protein [Paenibacillus sp. GD4]
MSITMTKHYIARQRLLHQRIASDFFGKPEQVVQYMGALQAQDYHQVLWAVGSRLQSASVTEVEQAIAEGKMVLTWLLRGTIHMVSSDDVRWMLKLVAPRLQAREQKRHEQLGLTKEMVERSRDIIVHALQGNQRLTRDALMELLENSGIGTSHQRGYHLLWYFAQSGLICMGPKEGKQQTFVLLEEWVPRSRDLSREEALALLAERYFYGHGPATVQDFAWWAGITLSDARKGLEAVSFSLESLEMEDRVYWVRADGFAGREGQVTSVHLLPGFDEYVLGYKERDVVLEAEFAPRVVPGNNGVFMPTIVIDGQVSGIWKRTLKSKGIHMEIDLFLPMGNRRNDMEEAARRYCSFMGMSLLDLSISS